MNKLSILLITLSLTYISQAQGWGEGWRGEGGYWNRPWSRPWDRPWNRPWNRPWGWHGEGGPWGKRDTNEDINHNEDESVSLRAVSSSKLDDSSQEQAECRFILDKSKLTCNGGLVDCDVIARVPNNYEPKFEMFGIGLPNDKSEFRLYPKNLTDVVYLRDVTARSTDNFGTKSFDLKLFNGDDNMVDHGLVVKDKRCFERVVNFFKSIKAEIVVDLPSDGKNINKANLLGYILYV